MNGVLEAIGARVRMLVGRGRIRTGDDAGGVQKQQVQMGGTETGDNRARVAEFGFTSMPPPGTDAVVVFLGGDRSAGVIVATNHQESRPRNLKAGETAIYSLDGKIVYLSAAGIRIDAKGQPVDISNASVVTVDATLLRCTGDIQDNFETNPHTMAEMRQIFNSHDHDVRNVQSGGSTVTSDHPNQTE